MLFLANQMKHYINVEVISVLKIRCFLKNQKFQIYYMEIIIKYDIIMKYSIFCLIIANLNQLRMQTLNRFKYCFACLNNNLLPLFVFWCTFFVLFFVRNNSFIMQHVWMRHLKYGSISTITQEMRIRYFHFIIQNMVYCIQDRLKNL